MHILSVSIAKTIFPIFWMVLLLTSFSNNISGQTLSDSAMIVQLIQKEAVTWRSGDRDGHAECWQERPYSRILLSTPTGTFLDIPVSVIINPSEDIFGKGGTAFLSNFKMSIHGDEAWVSHDELSVAQDGSETYSKEIRILEKINMQWKLVGQSIHQYLPPSAQK